ncbi:MAG: Lpg1974 family pore-forming outer membrane protein [Pirellulales bacterium]
MTRAPLLSVAIAFVLAISGRLLAADAELVAPRPAAGDATPESELLLPADERLTSIDADSELLPGAEIISDDSCDACPVAPSACDCAASSLSAIPIYIPMLTPGWQTYAGLLMLQPSADNLGYAVITNELNLASPVPIVQPYWDVQALKPTYQPGFEVGGRYVLANSGVDMHLNWQHLRTTNSHQSAATQSTGQWISPFSQTGPPTAASFSNISEFLGVDKLRAAEARVNFAYDALNFDFGQYVAIGRASMFRLFAGLGYARLEERLVSNFHGLPPAPDAPFPANTPLWLSLDNRSLFWGVGPRFGFDTNFALRAGFRVNGELGGALLVGQTTPAQYLFTATSPELAAVGVAVNSEHVSSSSFAHVVYNANARLGFGWAHMFRNGLGISCDVGYLATFYANPFSGYETNNNILGLQTGSLSTASVRHTLSNFTAHGFYLDAGIKW